LRANPYQPKEVELVEQTRNKITNNQRDGNNRETVFASYLRKTFGITGPLSNKAISASFFLFLGFLVFLATWKTAGINWTRYAGAGCFLASFVVCALAFAAQTASQIIRMAEHARAAMKGEKPRKFREGTPEFAKIISKCFRFAKAQRDQRRLCAVNRLVRNLQSRTRNHARSYRRAARPAFARASSSPGDDDSGDSDSGDQPAHQNAVISPYYSEQPNRSDKKHRPSISPGKFRMPRRSQRRRFA
jgi:hypothetical protein